jgi:hypothetical protein
MFRKIEKLLVEYFRAEGFTVDNYSTGVPVTIIFDDSADEDGPTIRTSNEEINLEHLAKFLETHKDEMR